MKQNVRIQKASLFIRNHTIIRKIIQYGMLQRNADIVRCCHEISFRQPLFLYAFANPQHIPAKILFSITLSCQKDMTNSRKQLSLMIALIRRLQHTQEYLVALTLTHRKISSAKCCFPRQCLMSYGKCKYLQFKQTQIRQTFRFFIDCGNCFIV